MRIAEKGLADRNSLPMSNLRRPHHPDPSSEPLLSVRLVPCSSGAPSKLPKYLFCASIQDSALSRLLLRFRAYRECEQPSSNIPGGQN